jgi:hypothetical protein
MTGPPCRVPAVESDVFKPETIKAIDFYRGSSCSYFKESDRIAVFFILPLTP